MHQKALNDERTLSRGASRSRAMLRAFARPPCPSVFTLTETRPPDSVARDVESDYPAGPRKQAVEVQRVRWMMKNLWLLLGALAGVASIGCQSGGIGDPCTPEEEYDQDFSGFSAGEVSVESRSFQCKSRVCLVANFQGRTSCPYGQPDPGPGGSLGDSERCFLPGTPARSVTDATGCTNCVNGKVDAQIQVRRPETAVYCSCRCEGPDSNVRYCECPSGYSCEKLISQFGVSGGGGQLVGSYCVKEGTKVDNPGQLAKEQPCNAVNQSCGPDKHPAGSGG